MNLEMKDSQILRDTSPVIASSKEASNMLQNTSPRLESNILIKRAGKVSSVEKRRMEGLSAHNGSRTRIKPSNSSKNRIIPSKNDPPMNLMQFRGVRVKPDKKVLDILSILNEYRKTCEVKGQNIEAKKAKKRYCQLKLREEIRHERNLNMAHDKEMEIFELNQRSQFDKFTNAWDSYMVEYEEAALMSLNKMNEQHQREILELRKRIISDYPIIGKPINKKIIDLK